MLSVSSLALIRQFVNESAARRRRRRRRRSTAARQQAPCRTMERRGIDERAGNKKNSPPRPNDERENGAGK